MGVNGEKLENVSVKITDGHKNYSKTTTKTGFFHAWLQPGSYEMEVNSNGYLAQNIQFYVKINQRILKSNSLGNKFDPDTERVRLTSAIPINTRENHCRLHSGVYNARRSICKF